MENNKKLLEETEVNENTVTFYSACESHCGYFEYSILLHDDNGQILEDSQALTYYPKGYTNRNEFEIWDNSNFLRHVLDDNIKVTGELRKEIGDYKLKNLINLLKQVRKKGWL